MKWGFILVTLYTGLLGLLLYVLADKEPHSGTHEEFIKPLSKQGIGSTIHCIAGDATGIIAAAVITATLGLPMWVDLIVEYVAGFSVGLFVFQALFMRSMMGGTYLENVRRSFVPEFISMNFMMAAMAPVMTLLMMSRDMRAMDPTQLVFWGVMSLGIIAGYALAYPSNVWMVAKSLKHGLMTERKPGTKFADQAPQPARNDKPAAPHAGHDMGAMASGGGDQPKPHDMAAVGKGAGKGGDAKGGGGGHEAMKSDATRPQVFALGMVSVVALAAGMIAPASSVTCGCRRATSAIRSCRRG